MTQRLLSEEFRKARIAARNHQDGLARLDLFQKAEFVHQHPEWAMCVRCDNLEETTGGEITRATYLCYACDTSERQ